MNSPIFLIGTQRSGTTLLCQMLSAHRDIFIKNEVPVRSVFKAEATRDEIETGIDQAVKSQLGKGIAELLKVEGKSIWGLKDPELTAYLGPLKQFLPGARFIIITRDARAVVNSYMENKWGLGTNAYTGAERWRNEVEEQLSFEADLPGKAYRIRYEDLVMESEQVLKGVCEFLQVPFDKGMLDYTRKKVFVTENRENKNTFLAPDITLTRKWQKTLNSHEIRVIDSVCEKTMERCGYEVQSDFYKPPAWMVQYYRVHQAVIGELQIQYRWRIGHWKRKWVARAASTRENT